MARKLVFLLLFSILFSTEAPAGNIIFAHGANPGNPRYLAAEKWADYAETCMSEPHSISIAPSALMGDDIEMLASLIAGAIHVSANSQGPLAQVVPEFGLLGLPFLFKDSAAAWRVLDGKVGHVLDVMANKHGYKILGYWDNGIRHISHVSKTFENPSDLKGVHIRTPPDLMAIQIFKALEAIPRTLAFSKVPWALKTGEVEGQENPLTNIYSSHIHKITPYITLTGHKYEVTPVVVSLDWWNTLTKKKQTCLQGATKEAGKYQRELSRDENRVLYSRMMKEGVVFAEADRAAYIKRTKKIYDAYAEKFPEVFKLIMDEASNP